MSILLEDTTLIYTLNIPHQISHEYFIISILRFHFFQYYHIYSTIGTDFMNLSGSANEIINMSPNYYNISKFVNKIIRKTDGHIS